METKNNDNKTLTYLLLLVIILMSGLVVYFIKESNKKSVYIISDSGRFVAKQSPEDKLYKHDIKNQVQLFTKSFFEYDKYSFSENIESALGLVDESTGKMIYKTLKEAGIYEILKEKKVRTKVKIDTLLVDMSKKPVKCKILFRQYIYIGETVQENPVGAIFEVVPYSKSEGNPFGQLIINYKYINYQPQGETKSMYFKTYSEIQKEAFELQSVSTTTIE